MATLIPATSRTLAAFEIFAREKRELSNSEMARLLALPDSSCSDLLNTMHALGYLMRMPRTRRFYPTARLYEIARQIAENDPVAKSAKEAVQQLVEKTNESAFVGVLDRSAVKVVAVLPCRRPLRYIMEVGDRAALHASAIGKALLGQLEPDALQAQVKQLKLDAVTPLTITNARKLVADVAQGRKQGWYTSDGEGVEGVTALAVPGALGEQPVGLSLAGPSDRVHKHRKAYLQALFAVRDSLSA
ncbi:transcriptional regulator, IclR family, C-terminal domain protein [Bordetella bronchiseptica GA96-01]|uniref:IclR family transcriptional regulator n=1 Tax=Bordetella bronchiseptica TaxID=518 RepID=UPI00045A965C|nr:IclR family transcriptional regulator [Bordetella bronchiseptica]AZW29670.1 IclR family transcriptional regulator [Bordetella bronchiseptica]KCV45859.1 transcriptional regulator, IclR family, C-terminal domain protein [Bordetella bronchiseptica 345]KDC41710.1 transcriptional regulator, IclR family, C-terminal domain protein [Bordetella bronchiseptica GA96-01]